MDTPLKIRSFLAEDDLLGLTELVNAARSSALSPEQILAQLSSPGFEINRDCFVTIRGNWLVATGTIYPQSSQRFFINIITHPDARRQGIGRLLLEHLLRELEQRGGQQVTCAIRASNATAQAFAAACGFTLAGEVCFFDADAGLALPAPQVPSGYSLHSIADLGDPQVFVDACNRCYQDMWGHSENLEPLTVEKVDEWHRQFPNILRPEGMFVLLSSDGRPAGVTRADREGEGDHEVRVIDAPGVAPEYRHLGLQRSLVLAAAAWLRQNGAGPYQIQTWGDSPQAREIYLSLGFRLDESTHLIEFVRYLGETPVT